MPLTTTVGAVMTRKVVSCAPDDDLAIAETRMAKAQISRILVLDGRRCVGVISLSDISQAEEPDRTGRLVAKVARRQARPRKTVYRAPGSIPVLPDERLEERDRD
jgi:signal-transduction protein with cAMP-binding, CBS, and nucleotidyltransferase domain